MMYSPVKRCAAMMLSTALVFGAAGCSEKRPDSLDRPVTEMGKVNPVYDRFFAEAGDDIDLAALQDLIAEQCGLRKAGAEPLANSLVAWRREAVESAGPDVLASLSNLNRHLFETRDLALKNDPNDVAAGLLVGLTNGRSLTPLSAAWLYYDFVSAMGAPAAMVEWPGGFGVQVTHANGQVYVWPAHQGRAYTPQGLQQYFLDDRRFNLAESDLRAGLFLKPMSKRQIASRFLAHTGCGLFQRGDEDAGLDHLTVALLLDPANREALHLRGDAYLSQGNLHLALADYDRALAAGADYALSHFKLAEAYLNLDYAKALSHYAEALRLKPNFAAAYCGQGRTLARMNRRDDAIASYQAGLQTDPKNAPLLRALAELYMQAGEFGFAAPQYRLAVAANPYDQELYIGLGTCLQKLNKDAEALTFFEQGIAKLPAAHELRYYKAALLLRMNRPADAAMEYKTILATAARPGSLNERIADAAALAADYPEALTYYKRALDTQDNRMVLHFKSARVYAQQGERKEAVNWLRASQALGFSDYDAVSADPAFQILLTEYSLRDIFGDR